MALAVGVALGGASGAAAACRYNYGLTDGCAGAPANGVFIKSAPFAAYAAQSGQTWASPHPWPWNAPGVDYAVGYSLNTPLLDPATAPLPAGCAFNPTGSASGGAIVRCFAPKGQTVKSPTIRNIDFSLYGCTVLQFDAMVTGTITVINNNFRNGPNCAVGGATMVHMLNGPANLVFENNLVDGGWPTYQAPLAADISDNSPTGTALFEYNAIINSPQRPINVLGNGNVITKYNYFDGWILNQLLAEHGEVLMQVLAANETVKSATYSFNTAVVPAAAPQLGPSPFVLAGGPGLHDTFAAASIDHNVVVTNLSGGAGGGNTVSAALADLFWGIYGTLAFVDNYVDPTGALSCIFDAGGSQGDVGSMAANTLTITSINTGAVYPRSSFQATGVTRAVVMPYGTVDPATGMASTGTGGPGTYVLSGPAQTASFIDGANVTSPIGKMKAGGNISLVTGSPITGHGGKVSGATCPPLF